MLNLKAEALRRYIIKKMNKFYITTPLYYVNAKAHIGHAYTNVACDCLARYHRLLGQRVHFLTGTDEHGQKIKKSAEESGQDIQVFVDTMADNFRKLWGRLNISYDDFIRTTQSRHKEAVKKVLSVLYEKGDIYKSSYEGWYCLHCETFWNQSQIKESKGLCPDCSRPVEEIKEENYFFRVSRYQEWLIGYIKSNPEFIRPQSRYNEVLGFLKNNQLLDLCISRPQERLSWGVKMPFDNKYVTYVWFDALLNYISAVGFGSNEEQFQQLWPADLHVVGKDILRQHAVYWPIMLKALGIEMPKTIFAHGWWLVDKEKMSKSKGNIVDPFSLADEFGVDALRYFLLREIPFGLDGTFSRQAIISRINSDLANDLGNIVFRVLNMVEKYFQGTLQVSKSIPEEFKEPLEEIEKNYFISMGKLEFSSAAESVWKFINVMNKYIEDKKPWAMKKEGKDEELAQFLSSLAEGIKAGFSKKSRKSL